MTACVNRKHTKKVAAVVTASLVGALSLGVAPVAAMATEGEISLQALDSSAIAGGTVTYKGGEDGQTFTYNGHKQGLSADTLDPKGGADAEKLQAHPGGYPEAGYYYYYIQLDGTADSTLTGVQYTDANGNKQTVSGKYLGGEMPDEVGSYAVVTGYWSGSAWTYVSTAARFTIAPQSLEGATIFEGTDVNDTEFAWDGFNYTNTPALIKADMGVALDGVILNPTTDYSLKIIDPATGAEPTYVMPGTTYAAHIEGAGNYAGQHEDVKFTFGKCDIVDLNIVGKVANRTAPQVPYAIASIVDSIDGKTNFADFAPNQYTIEFVSGPDGAENDWTAGTYTFKIKANPGSTLVEGEQTFQYINAERVADITYDGDAWNTAFPTGEYNVDFSSETAEALSPSKIAATYVNADGETVKIPASKIQISGATAEELTQPGKHVVDVLIYFVDENNELVAQQKSVTVNNYYSVIEATDIFFTFDGENVDGSTDADYTGEDFTEKMAFEVYAGKKLLTEGTDYTVVYEQQQKDGKWVEVDSIVDAADYRITVKAANEGILISGGEFKFTVNRALLTAVPNGLVWDWADSSSDHDRSFLPYTGAVQDVTFKFTNADGETVEVPADSYDVVISVYGQTKESEVKEKGKYIARFDDDEVANYDLPADKTFWVDDAKSFSDVHDSDWYLGSVFQAKENGYVHGISGTDMFAPEQDIKRGDVVVILFNMANGKYDADKDFGYVEGAGYMTGFDDVESTMYYAQAIAWAKATGVVNGYDGTNDFRPDAPVTREEFAAMLSNYAELTGVDVVGAEADLSAFDDAVQVSGWAKEAVEWTVSAKVMGNGGFLAPQANITRAEVAAMAVNFQPEML